MERQSMRRDSWTTVVSGKSSIEMSLVNSPGELIEYECSDSDY